MWKLQQSRISYIEFENQYTICHLYLHIYNNFIELIWLYTYYHDRNKNYKGYYSKSSHVSIFQIVSENHSKKYPKSNIVGKYISDHYN